MTSRTPHATQSNGPADHYLPAKRALAPKPASIPHPASDPDASRHPAPRRSMLTSALTRGPCVWRCDFAARRPGRPLGVRARRPGRPAARQEGGWAAAAPSSRRRSGRGQGGLLGSPLALAAASLSNSPHPAQPRAGAAPRGAGSQRRGDRALAAHPDWSAWCPRAPRVNAISSAQEERAGRRAGDARGEQESESRRKKVPGRPGCARSRPRAPGGPCAPRQHPLAVRAPLRLSLTPARQRALGGGRFGCGVPVEPSRTLTLHLGLRRGPSFGVTAGTSGRGFGPASCSQMPPVSGLVTRPGSHPHPTMSPHHDLLLTHFYF